MTWQRGLMTLAGWDACDFCPTQSQSGTDFHQAEKSLPDLMESTRNPEIVSKWFLQIVY